MPPIPARTDLPPLPEFIAIIATMMALTALSIDIMLPALPAIGETFALADANAPQLVVTAYMLGFAAGQIVYGPLSDRFGRKPVLIAGLAIYAGGTVATILADSFNALLAARAIQGIGCAAPRVIAIAVVRDAFGGRQMAHVMSFVISVFIIVPAIAPSLGEGLLLFGHWEWIFLFLLAVSVGLAVLTSLRLPETRAPQDREPLSPAWLAGAVWETVSNRQTLGYTLATGAVFGSLIGYVNSAQQVFVGVYGLGSLFPIAFGGIAMAMALASFINGRLVQRLGMRRLSHGALIGFILVAAVHAGVALTLNGPPPLPLFLAFMALDLFFFGFIMSNFNAMAMEPLHRIAGTASSFIGCFTTGAAAILGWVVGQSFDGTVVPLALGYLALGSASLALVLATEGGRLFRPRHEEA